MRVVLDKIVHDVAISHEAVRDGVVPGSGPGSAILKLGHLHKKLERLIHLCSQPEGGRQQQQRRRQQQQKKTEYEFFQPLTFTAGRDRGARSCRMLHVTRAPLNLSRS